MTADPRLALLGVDVAVLAELRLAPVLERGVHEKRRKLFFNFGLRRQDEEGALILSNLLVNHRIEQVLDQFDVVLADGIADLDLALGIGFDVGQFLRVGPVAVAGMGHQRPPGTEDAGAAETLCGFLHEIATAVVVIVAFDMHLSISPAECCEQSLLQTTI